MIFTAIGLLVVALVMLVAGIIRSSTALLTLSVLATLVACAVLFTAYRYYRAKAAAEAPEGEVSPPGWPRAYRGAAGDGASALQPAPVAVPGGEDVPVAGWDELPEEQAARMVEALNLDDLHRTRRHEVEHAHRDEVLRAVDARIETLVALRRSVSPGR